MVGKRVENDRGFGEQCHVLVGWKMVAPELQPIRA